jgi:hypothetical protein
MSYRPRAGPRDSRTINLRERMVLWK